MPRNPERELLGRKFSYWTVAGFGGYERGMRFWSCVCQCQRLKPNPLYRRIREDHLRGRRTESCGCYRSRLMMGNRRASKNKATEPKTPNQSNASPESILAAWQGVISGTNLKGESNSLAKCPHGVYLALRNTAKYCQFCTEQQYERTGNLKSWNRRLYSENLACNRGLAPSTDEPTSRKARTFTKTADKVWAGGKNLILVGGAGDLEITGAVRETRWRTGGKKRSASGRDPIAPGQNPNVDIESDWETVSFRETKSGFDNPDTPLGETISERDEEKRIRKLDRLKDESSLVEDDQ